MRWPPTSCSSPPRATTGSACSPSTRAPAGCGSRPRGPSTARASTARSCSTARRVAASMAKAFAGDAFFRIGASAIQVFGGIGFTWEHDVHLFYKRLLTLQQAHGTGTEHLEELADLILPSVSSANG